MTLRTELSQLLANQFVALILDNEVTVGHFVTSPALPWTRITQRHGIYQVAEGISTSFDGAANEDRDEKLGPGFVAGHHAHVE